MLSGKELILATKQFAQEIRWKSWFHTITTLTLLLVSITGTVLFKYGEGPLFLAARIGCSLFTAMLFSRFFIIFHDFQHHTILNKSKVANVIFTIFGSYFITPPSIWKRSHDHHHKNNAKLFAASIGSYPIMTRQKFETATKGERFAYLAIRHPLNMMLSYFTTFLYGMCLQSFIANPRKHLDGLAIFIAHVAVAVLLFIFAGWDVWLLTFFLPFFLSHMLGAYLFYAQHNFPTAKFRNNSDWNYTFAALESSSFMKLSRFWHWVTGNIGYHHIHHLNARIPFYRLPEAMAKVPELRAMNNVTTLKPRDIIACLRLKVWDPEMDKMIGFREMRLAPLNNNQSIAAQQSALSHQMEIMHDHH